MNAGATPIAGLEHAARAMPFDQFGRYHMIREAVDACRAHLSMTMSVERFAILDVGGYFPGRGHPLLPITLFLPDDTLTVLDVVDCALPGYVKGDGHTLPFPDDRFDLVVSADTLEHVPPQQRNGFWGELLRVARHGVILLAPFQSTEVEIAETILFEYIKAELGVEQQQLQEHAACGLPDLPHWLDWLEQQGLAARAYPTGYLHAWLGMMLIKHMLLRIQPDLEPLVDWYYNRSFFPSERRRPAYRHLVSATRTTEMGLAIDAALAPTILPDQQDAATDWSHALMPLILALGQRQTALEQRESLHHLHEQYRLRMAQYDDAFRDLSARARWLEAQNQALQQQLEAVQRGRLMRLLNLFRKK